jgi:hypothetical protein
MNTHKNNDKTLWALAALCLAALSLTAGTGCNPQGPGVDAKAALEDVMNPTAAVARHTSPTSPTFGTRLGFGDTMDRLVNPVIDARLGKAESSVTSRLASPENAELVGISLHR